MGQRREIAPDELRDGLRNGKLTLVDVLPEESYASGHIPGAINLPIETLTWNLAENSLDPRASKRSACFKTSVTRTSATILEDSPTGLSRAERWTPPPQ
jgi:rhodanese-related sulfurtransferase